MSEDKISSDEVPWKFNEWLLAMGCPEDIVPSVDKVAKTSRGQYYMVWRSLMEHVDKRSVVRHKRLQVFADDMRRCQQHQRTVLTEVPHNFKGHSNTIPPEQLSLWRQQQELREKVEVAKERAALPRQNLHQLADKISGKVIKRDLARRKLEDTTRRAWLLQQVAQELRNKQTELRETDAIAHSLCSPDEDDIQGKIDRCLTLLRKPEHQHPSLQPASNSTANSTSGLSSSGYYDFEDQLAALVKFRGDALCTELYERRASLVSALTCNSSTGKGESSPRKRLTPVVAHTTALYCSLALDAVKNKQHLKQARHKLAAAVSNLSEYLPGDACELLAIRCEQAYSEARIASLQLSLDDIKSRQGVFSCVGEQDGRQAESLTHINKAIVSKREELLVVIACSKATESKINLVRQGLAAVFAGFHKEQLSNEFKRYKGIQLEMPKESVASLRQYYETRRATRRHKMEISLELESSDGSFSEAIDYNNPRFTDELRLYLQNFSLERNRKLVLETGEKIWIFETVAASLDRLHAAWAIAEASSTALAVAPGAACVRTALRAVGAREQLAELQAIRIHGKTDIDIQQQIEEEEQAIDRIKKRLDQSLLYLQKTIKTLDLADEDLRLWSQNALKKYVSSNRIVNGMSYKQYELNYLDNLALRGN